MICASRSCDRARREIVLRLLDKNNLAASIDKLGLDADTFSQFKNAIDAPHGLILVTGPTGSGKTTTLYPPSTSSIIRSIISSPSKTR